MTDRPLARQVQAIEEENEHLRARVAILEQRLGPNNVDIPGLELMFRYRLRRQQAEVLHALIAAEGRPLDRYALENRITWRDHAADHDLKLMDVLICQLRQAIGREKIQTVHGRGWRVVPERMAA